MEKIRAELLFFVKIGGALHLTSFLLSVIATKQSAQGNNNSYCNKANGNSMRPKQILQASLKLKLNVMTTKNITNTFPSFLAYVKIFSLL